MPKDELDGFEVKFSAITKEMAFYLVNVFNKKSAKSLTPSNIAFDIYVNRKDGMPLIRLFPCSVIQNIITSERYCNILVSDNRYVDLHGINFDPSMEESWGLECINIKIL